MFKNKFLLKIIIKITITLLVIALSLTAVYFLSKQINKDNQAFNEKKALDYLVVNRGSVSNKIQTDFLEVDQNYQAKINEAIPSVYNVLSFVDAMDSLSKKYSFKENLNFDQPTPATDLAGPVSLTAVKFNLAISDANIDNFVNYLQDFEKLPYFASIDSINYLGNTDAGWKDNSSINITGSFYAHQ